jgi:hydroxymethylpyrimidine/phosphomethylpyrimidine kinase
VAVPCCLTIAGSDSGGGAGIQADLKAFARCGCHGTSAIVALTAQNTVAVTGVLEVPAEFVLAQLEAVFEDFAVAAVKTGMLFSAATIETVAAFLGDHRLPLVVDPVMSSTSGGRLLREDAVSALVTRLFPLAAVVTPNLHEACALAGRAYREDADRAELAEAIHELGARAVIVTGGHGVETVDWLYDGRRHLPIPVERLPGAPTHGSGCTHSASLAALLARGIPLLEAARGAARLATESVRNGLTGLGAGSGPVDVLGIEFLGREALPAR